MTAIRALTAVLIIMFPVGLGLMILPQFSSKYLWTTNLFLGLQSLILFLLYREISSLSAAFKLATVIFICSFSLELLGVNTGFPFGDYTYTASMSPLLFGVPLSITFAWFSVSSTSFFIARLVSGGKYFSTAVGSAFLILAADILLEPFASDINRFWMWDRNTVPVSNYISWFLAGFLFSLLINKLIFGSKSLKELKRNFYVYPVLIFCINACQFIIINLINGYVTATVTGFFLMILVIVLLRIERQKNEV